MVTRAKAKVAPVPAGSAAPATGGKISIRGLFLALPFTGHGRDVPVGDLEQAIASLQLEVSPRYQRGHRWTLGDQESFVGHVLTGGKVPALIVREVLATEVGADDIYELLDGKQRITALRLWLAGKIRARVGERLIHIDETDRQFRSLTIRMDYVRCETVIAALRLYLRLNSGVAHTREELARVEEMIAEEEQALRGG